MEIGKAFSHVTEDESWVSKILIGGLVSIVPIVNFAVLGYMLKVAQNVASGVARPLPEWGEFGDHFMRGLYGIAIYLVYFLPIIILEGLFFCLTGALAAGSSDSNGSGGAAVGLIGLCFFPLIFILALALSVVLFAALARYVATGTLSEAFKFSEVIASVRSNFSPWLMLWLVALLAGIVGSLGSIACGVGALFTGFYAQCVIGHALGQTVADLRMGGDPYATQQMPPSNYPPSSF